MVAEQVIPNTAVVVDIGDGGNAVDEMNSEISSMNGPGMTGVLLDGLMNKIRELELEVETLRKAREKWKAEQAHKEGMEKLRGYD